MLVVAGFSTFGYALAVVPALVTWHAGANAVLAIWAGAYLLAGTYAWLRLSAFISPAARAATPAILFEQARFAFKSGSVSVAGFLNLRVDVFVVGILLDARTLGIYSLAVGTAELLWQLSQPLGWSTFGRIAVADRDAAIALTATVTRNTLAVMTVAGAVLFAIAPAAIVFVYGSAYAETGHVLRWLIPGTVCYAVNGTLGYYVIVREGKLLAISLAGRVGGDVRGRHGGNVARPRHLRCGVGDEHDLLSLQYRARHAVRTDDRGGAAQLHATARRRFPPLSAHRRTRFRLAEVSGGRPVSS